MKVNLTKNLIFWLDYTFLHFGIAKFLQNKEHNLYGIVDASKSINNFFQNQKFVNFKRLWYFYDYISNTKPNLDYLEEIEEKYKINLWNIVYSDRYFYKKFNPFYKFSNQEILSIIEQECHFFEKIISENKPDYFLMNTVTHHYQYLLYKICKSLKIPILTLEPLRFSNKWMVVNGLMYELNSASIKYNSKNSSRSFKEIQKFIKSTSRIPLGEPSSIRTVPKLMKLKAFLHLLLVPTSIEQSKRFSTYGRTRKNIITKGAARIFLIRRKLRESFINRNFLKEIPNVSFVYFPLHLEPERVLLLGAPYYADQLSIISNIAKSLPVGYQLLVKEHPNMKSLGWRSKSFYKQIIDLPNVKLIHPSVSPEKIIKNSKLVITIRGTASLEAVFYGIPSIAFKADISHTLISSVHVLKNITELPDAIHTSLKKTVNPSQLNKYLDFVEENSFEFNSAKYSDDVANHFEYNVGFLHDPVISNNKMKSFLDKFSPTYDTIAKEYKKNFIS